MRMFAHKSLLYAQHIDRTRRITEKVNLRENEEQRQEDFQSEREVERVDV